MYFHPSFLRVKMIERLFTQTYIGCQSTPPFWDFYTLLNPLQQVDHVWEEQGGRKGGANVTKQSGG